MVGLGAGALGAAELPDGEVERLVGAALDAGVTLIDTARSYGLSEERLGRALEGRRDAVVLSTKVGYGIPGLQDWTGPCIEAGVDAALRRLRTDRLDVVHLHSCDLQILERGDVLGALLDAVRAGKVRVAAYSGEGEALDWAIASGSFGAIQCSVSVVDQAVLADDGPLARARATGLGVLAKRALGNAPWRFAERPLAGDVAEAWERFRAMDLLPGPLPWPELFARFAAHTPGVSTILQGTSKLDHLRAVVDGVSRGPLDATTVTALRAAFARQGRWSGRI